MNAILSLLFAATVPVYPQNFARGGWSLDPQFMDVMGSPYLLAHGVGSRVCDATATVAFPTAGTYRVWARTRNWADGAPGRFRIAVDGRPLKKVFGAAQRTWGWEDGGEVTVGARAEVRLQDLTGFDGRCAGLVFADDGTAPTGALRMDDAAVAETVEADFVVVGGGLPGTCAALAAARRGLRVALVQDRPTLGGNASSEIRVWAAGEARYPLVREVRNLFMNRDPNQALCDARRMRLVEDEKTLKVFLSTRVFAAETRAGALVAAKGLDLKDNRVIRFAAPLFCDATGDGWLGFYAGADCRMGREGRDEYGEGFAPEKGDGDTLGASIMWTSAEANDRVAFAAPWAEPFAQGETAIHGEWNWEYGIHRDMIAEGEEIRDRLLLAIYGAFSRAKKDPKHANRVIDFCPYLLGKRESRRLMGDWVLSEKDITERRPFADAIASGSWSIDLHYDTFKPGVDFLTDCEQPHYGRYFIPYRAIYSRNVGNLFMAGRCFSCTHIGLGSPRVMNTLAQLGVAAGEAAALCRAKGLSPRGLYEKGCVRELQEILGGGFPGVPEKATAGWIVVDDEDDGVRFGAGWTVGHNPNGEQVGHVSHFAGGTHWKPVKPAGLWVEDATYPVPIPRAGRYAVYGRVPWHHAMKPGSRTVFKLVGPGFSFRFEGDQGLSPGTWRKFGEFPLAPGTTLVILAGESEGTVVADGFAFEPLDAAPAADGSHAPSLMGDARTLSDWTGWRRAEVTRALENGLYGRRPVERPADLAFAVTSTEDVFGGTAVKKLVRATCSGPGGALALNFAAWIPKRAAKVPAYVYLSPRVARDCDDPDKGRPEYTLPAAYIVSRGYAVVAVDDYESAPDWDKSPARATNGVFLAFGPQDARARGDATWGILSAWAWGASRALDWLETEPLVDARHVAVCGLSRNGKAALIAGATDARFALAVSCCSGEGGAKLRHFDCPGSETVKDISIAWRWFAPSYVQWVGRDREMPFDQHWLLALMAPRLCYVSSASDDDWAGPKGEYAAAALASEAWRLYGKRGLVSDGFPARDTPRHAGEIGYHLRTGRHALERYDWEQYLNFTDRHGWTAQDRN